MARYGYVGTAWVDPVDNDPININFNKKLLANGVGTWNTFFHID